MRMLDMISLGPVFLVGFGYWLGQRHEAKEIERLSAKPLAIASTGDKELDSILGIVATLPVIKSS